MREKVAFGAAMLMLAGSMVAFADDHAQPASAPVPRLLSDAPMRAEDFGGADGTGAALVAQIESKWSGVMRNIKGWNDSAIEQFREGYSRYPAAVLRQALAAGTFEDMTATLDKFATLKAQGAMNKAFPLAGTRPEDGDDPNVAAAKSLISKTLGDDARDLTFIPVTPCTVWDTRYATDPGAAGSITNGATRRFYSHMSGVGGSYAAFGGNASCPETAQTALGGRPYAVMMTVYINNPTANGWLTLYRNGDPDPSQGTISVYYSPGPTRTQTVISKSNRGWGVAADYDVAATSRYGTTDASASVVGYFMKAVAPTVYPIVGFVNGAAAIAVDNSAYHFASPTVSIPVASAGTRLTGSASAILGSSGGQSTFRYALCRQLGTGAVTPFNGLGGFLGTVSATESRSFSASATVTGLAAGTYTVGYCVMNIGPNALDNNDFAIGWVRVEN